MLNLVPDDPVQAAGGAIRYLLAMRPEHESVYEFLMRLADYEQGRTSDTVAKHFADSIVSDAPASSAEPIVVDKPRRSRKSQLAENETLHWPPIRGQKYVGQWPPAGMCSPLPKVSHVPEFPLDANQNAWLQRYAKKYPDQYNPNLLLTAKEATARERAQLLAAELT